MKKVMGFVVVAMLFSTCAFAQGKPNWMGRKQWNQMSPHEQLYSQQVDAQYQRQQEKHFRKQVDRYGYDGAYRERLYQDNKAQRRLPWPF